MRQIVWVKAMTKLIEAARNALAILTRIPSGTFQPSHEQIREARDELALVFHDLPSSSVIVSRELLEELSEAWNADDQLRMQLAIQELRSLASTQGERREGP